MMHDRFVVVRSRQPWIGPDPTLFGGFKLLVLILIVTLLGTALGLGQTADGGERTVEWYAARPAELLATTAACRNDPGLLRASRDCVNADQARIVAAEREARRTRGDWTPPTMPEYWVKRPLERAQTLAYCDRMTLEQQARGYCDVARRAGD